jgi:hypothetical protein
MSFVPVIPANGYQGWVFLTRTLESQRTAFLSDPAISRATAAFQARIGEVKTAQDLVADRQLLDVALTAFGLEADIDARAFIEKVLSEGTLSSNSFANRLSDKRYANLSREFGFGDLGPRTGLTGFSDEITARFEARSFEAAVGNVDDRLRRALNLQQGLADIFNSVSSPDARWFAVMGDLPLRSVFEGALGLPSSLGKLDLDRQLDTFKSRFETVFGSTDLSVLDDKAAQERLIRLYLVRTDATASSAVAPGSVALQLLAGAAAR